MLLPSSAVPTLSCGSVGGLTGTGAACVLRAALPGARESGGALRVSVYPPVTPGGLPLTRYEVEWSLSPTFSSTLPRDDKGTLTLADPDALYGTQAVGITAGSGLTGGCPLTGTWAITYGYPPPGSSYNATEVALRTTPPLPADATPDALRNALSTLYNLPTGVVVSRSPSTVALLDPRDPSGKTGIAAVTPPAPPPPLAAPPGAPSSSPRPT